MIGGKIRANYERTTTQIQERKKLSRPDFCTETNRRRATEERERNSYMLHRL